MTPGGDVEPRLVTRHLPPDEPEAASATAAPAVTGPLDTLLPWVIEFRIIGTATTVQAQVREAMVLGRGDQHTGYRPEVDLLPFDAFNKGVSRRHAIITVKNSRLYLRDLNSTNGTRVNSTVCTPGVEQRLRHGDEVVLGQLRMQLTFAVVPSVGIDQTTEMSVLPKAAARGDGQRVLIVENDENVGGVFEQALRDMGYEPTLVSDVTRGLGQLFQAMPDAIIIDMMLPEMNGLDLLHYVRRQKATKRVPVLVIDSGSKGGFQINQAMEAGADIILNKPVAVSTLVETLGGVLALAN